MAKDKDSKASVSNAAQDSDTDKQDAPSEEQKTPAQLSIYQWCSLTGKVPHRTMSFVRSQPQNEQKSTKTADEWDAAFDAFMQTPLS